MGVFMVHQTTAQGVQSATKMQALFAAGDQLQCDPQCCIDKCLPITELLLLLAALVSAAGCSFYYVKSYAEGSGIVRLPAGIV
jgi:hypothetical protein